MKKAWEKLHSNQKEEKNWKIQARLGILLRTEKLLKLFKDKNQIKILIKVWLNNQSINQIQICKIIKIKNNNKSFKIHLSNCYKTINLSLKDFKADKFNKMVSIWMKLLWLTRKPIKILSLKIMLESFSNLANKMNPNNQISLIKKLVMKFHWTHLLLSSNLIFKSENISSNE